MTTAPQESPWVFDIGGTYIKRAHTIYAGDELAGLEQLPSIPIPAFDDEKSLFEFMVQAITEKILNHPSGETLFINASLSNYVLNCQLQPDTPYGRLSLIRSDICQLFSETISERVTHPVKVTFVHDGTAAAKAYAGELDAAVITIGTALGIGFPPSNKDLRPLSNDFSIKYFASL